MPSHIFTTAASIAAIVAATPAIANAQQRSFDVVEQSAARGIVAFARQAGIQIIAPEEATRSRRTGAVRGRLDIGDGLRRLVAPSGLTVRSFDGRTAVLAAAAPVPRALAQMPTQAQPAPAAPAPAEAPSPPAARPGAAPPRRNG